MDSIVCKLETLLSTNKKNYLPIKSIVAKRLCSGFNCIFFRTEEQETVAMKLLAVADKQKNDFFLSSKKGLRKKRESRIRDPRMKNL